MYTPTATGRELTRSRSPSRTDSDTSATATVTVTVKPVNDAQFAAAVSVSTDEDSSVGVSLVGGDVDGDALTFTVQGGPAHGSLSGTGANRTYSPVGELVGHRHVHVYRR